MRRKKAYRWQTVLTLLALVVRILAVLVASKKIRKEYLGAPNEPKKCLLSVVPIFVDAMVSRMR